MEDFTKKEEKKIMPCKTRKKRKTRRSNPYNQVMKASTDVAKTAIGASTVAFVTVIAVDALKT